MTYKEELLKQIEDAKEWVNNVEISYPGEKGYTERLNENMIDIKLLVKVRTSMIDPKLIEECTFIDDLEYCKLDAWVSSQVIGCRKEKQLFNNMVLTDGSPAQLQKSIDMMYQKIKAIQKFTIVDDNIRIPLIPRDHLYKTLIEIKTAGYSEETLDSVFALVQRSGKRPQRKRLTDEFSIKLMKWADEMDRRKKKGEF